MTINKQWNAEQPIRALPELIHFQRAHLKSASILPEHKHENAFEFVYIEKGRATWHVGNVFVETAKGDVFHTDPDEPHSGRYNIIEPCTLWAVIVSLPPPVVPSAPPSGEHWLQLTASETTAVINQLRLLPRVVHPVMDTLRPLKQIADAIGHDHTLSNLRARSALLEFLLMLLQYREETSQAPHVISAELQQIVNELDAIANWNPTVKELADRIGISERYFHRLFQQRTQLTPKNYMERRRMQAACTLLKNRTLSITDIALELGFANSQHFATVFKRQMGRTPSNWRTGSPDRPDSEE